jgi:hypothetical protein
MIDTDSATGTSAAPKLERLYTSGELHSMSSYNSDLTRAIRKREVIEKLDALLMFITNVEPEGPPFHEALDGDAQHMILRIAAELAREVHFIEAEIEADAHAAMKVAS